MDSEELQTILSVRMRELATELATALAGESDLDMAFQLQMQEAMNASLALQPTPSSFSSSSTFPQFQRQDDDEVSDPSVNRLLDERRDREQAEAEMKCTRDDLNRRIHDQVFALDTSLISEGEWKITGDHFNRPQGEGSSSSSAAAVSHAEAFRLYFKGLVIGGMDSDVNKIMAGIGIAICDLRDDQIFKLRKPLVGGAMSREVAEVKSLIVGLNIAIALGIKRVTIFCDDNSLYQYLTGKSVPMQGDIATLVGQVTLLQRKFLYCNSSLVAHKDIKFAFTLAIEAIVSELTWLAKSGGKNLKESCLICMEDTDLSQMFSVNGCLHRYCSSCMKQHTEVNLLQGMLPKCPHDGCKSELKTESCKKLLTSELCDIMSQRLKEASIPLTQKIYCPYARCSALMTKTEALGNVNNDGASKCERCHGLFCMHCKVPWHSNTTCYDYKNLYPYPCADDAKLKSLAMCNLWRQCVKCNHMVELAAGCNHIHCRCGYQFCYTCGAEWKNKKASCTCPLWDERKIIYD